jgi:hypothetical protein
MKWFPLLLSRVLLLSVLGLPQGLRADDAPPPALIPNADLELDADGDQWPDGWPRLKANGSWVDEEGNHFLRLSSPAPDTMVMLYREVSLPAGTEALELSWRQRVTGLKVGKQAWFDARIMMEFMDAARAKVSPNPSAPASRRDTKGWEAKRIVFPVPRGATLLKFMPSLFHVASGTFDLDDIRLVAVPASAVPPPPPPPPVIASETVVPTDPAALPPELHAVSNRLETAAGKVVWLQGLSVDSLQWAARGERITNSIPVAIDQWKANAIRLAVSDGFWFGRGGHNQKQHDGGLAYRGVVDAAVEACARRGAYLVLDLHVFGAPKEAHLAFWKDAATRYKNHPAVLFELFNEPHSLSWKVWRDGGSLKEQHTDVNPAENKEAVEGETTPGMQALLQAVRATGARNLVVVGGLDWGYDLSGVAGEYALSEAPAGNGIVYSSHIYPWKKDWQEKVLAAAAKYPLFIGEVGCPPDYKGFQFIPENQRYPLEGWATDVLALIQANRLNWTGFSFHPKCGPMVISDWDYTPTPYWGVYVKDALAGKAFVLDHAR